MSVKDIRDGIIRRMIEQAKQTPAPGTSWPRTFLTTKEIRGFEERAQKVIMPMGLDGEK